jgi:hypothetical protein
MNIDTKTASHYTLYIGLGEGWNYDSLQDAIEDKEANEAIGMTCRLFVTFTDGTDQQL